MTVGTAAPPRTLSSLLLVALSLVAVGACGGDDETPTPTATPVPKEAMGAEASLAGRWEGTAVFVFGTRVQVVVDFETTAEGIEATMDVPGLGAVDAVLTVRFDFPRVHFEAKDLGAVFDGEFKDGAIEGDFQVEGLSGTLRLEKVR